nr:nucleopolyhedrovirus P10 family protein [Streptomyces taklimakanensis]
MLQSVRRQLAVGRLLPLGEATDGAWLAERAAAGVLRQAMRRLPGVRPGTVRVTVADFEAVGEPVVPPPPGALPPGPLRIDAEFDATADEPLPATAERVRTALAEAADGLLGLVVAAIDLRISGLSEGAVNEPAREEPPKEESRDGEPPADGGTDDTGGTGGALEAAVRNAASAVPGVVRLTSLSGDGSRPVRVGSARGKAGGVPSGHHVHIRLAVSADHRALDVVRRVRAAVEPVVADGTLGPVSVTVLVTEVVEVTGRTDTAARQAPAT